MLVKACELKRGDVIDVGGRWRTVRRVERNWQGTSAQDITRVHVRPPLATASTGGAAHFANGALVERAR